MSSIHPRDLVLLEQLKRHPALRARMESLLSVVEDAGGDLEKADAAEQRVIEELRQMGQEALTGWGERRLAQHTQEALEAPSARSAGKKTSTGTRRSAPLKS